MQRCFVLGCCFIPLSASSSPTLAKDANPLGLDLGGQFRALCSRAQIDRLFSTLAARVLLDRVPLLVGEFHRFYQPPEMDIMAAAYVTQALCVRGVRGVVWA